MSRRVLPGFGLSIPGPSVLEDACADAAGRLLPEGCVARTRGSFGRRFGPTRRAAYRLTLGVSLISSAIGVVLRLAGRLGAGALRVSAEALVDSLVDLPFALPTAVAGLVYSSLYVPNGWLGQFLVPLGFKVHTPAGHRAGADFHRACRSWSARCSRCWKAWTRTWRRRRACWGRPAGRPFCA